MYSPEVTQRAVAAARVTIRDAAGQPHARFTDRPLVYHSREQIDRAIDHYNNLWDSDRQRLRRPLTPDEQWFISNERTVCALDFRYWSNNYGWIKSVVTENPEPIRFKLNIAQQIILDLWAEDEANGQAIWMQQLKARRLGVSTLSELAVCHRFQFQPYSACLVASADPDKSIDLAGMIRFCLESQPWWLLPRQTKTKHNMAAEFKDLECTLSIESGRGFTGVGRGGSPTVIHLSECCEFQDAEDIITGGLMRAVIDTPRTFGIMESTGLGVGNWWHREWLKNKREYQRGTSRVRPVFLPWFVGVDLYPTDADRRKRPVPPDGIPLVRSINLAVMARQYVLTNPLLFKYLAKHDPSWTLPRAQMYWYELEYRTAKENKEMHIFLSELPADDFEAFQVNKIAIIDPEIIDGYRERTRNPLGVYTIIGPDIPPALIAPSRQFDTSKPTITIDTRDVTPNSGAKYQLIPLLFTGYDSLDEQLKLLIWEWPTFPHTYGVGVDCSEGVGQDNATIQVLREATPMREPGQVAEWAANTVTAFQLWPLIHAVSALYSTINPMVGERRQCRLAIETWSNGAAAQYELQKRGWSNFHPMYYAGDTRLVKKVADVRRIGVITNQTLRAHIQDMWMTCLKEEAIDLPSPYMIDEIATLENVGGKAQAALDCHDDRWMALGFPLYSLHMNKPPSQQFARKRVSYQPGLAADQAIAHPTWTPPQQESSRQFRPPTMPIYRDRAQGALGKFVNPDIPIRHR